MRSRSKTVCEVNNNHAHPVENFGQSVAGGGYRREQLESAPQLFIAPPFTEKVVESIRRISTRLSLKCDQASRLLWQQENNAASQSEYEALVPVFSKLPPFKSVLEIGPGFGRSAVFFSKMKMWNESAILHLYDTNGQETKYKQKHYETPPKWPDTSSFCGDLSFLRECLDYNGLRNYKIHDAAESQISSLPGPFDLIYAFYSVGFHWSLDYYLDDLLPMLDENGLLVCTLNKHFQMSSRLAEFETQIVEVRSLKKRSQPERILIFKKTPRATE